MKRLCLYTREIQFLCVLCFSFLQFMPLKLAASSGTVEIMPFLVFSSYMHSCLVLVSIFFDV